MKKFFKALSVTGATALTAAPVVSCNVFSPLKYSKVGSDKEVKLAVTPLKIDIIKSKKVLVETKERFKDLGIKGDPSWFIATQIPLCALFKQTEGKEPFKLKLDDRDSLLESLKGSSIETFYFAAKAKKGAKSFKISLYKMKVSLDKNNNIKIKTSEKHAKIIRL